MPRTAADVLAEDGNVWVWKTSNSPSQAGDVFHRTPDCHRLASADRPMQKRLATLWDDAGECEACGDDAVDDRQQVAFQARAALKAGTRLPWQQATPVGTHLFTEGISDV